MTTSSEKRTARLRSERTGETYQVALWRLRDVSRFKSYLEEFEAKGDRLLTDEDKRALWRGDSITPDPEQQWAIKWMFDKIDEWGAGKITPAEQAELVREIPLIFEEYAIRGFLDPFGEIGLFDGGSSSTR